MYLLVILGFLHMSLSANLHIDERRIAQHSDEIAMTMGNVDQYKKLLVGAASAGLCLAALLFASKTEIMPPFNERVIPPFLQWLPVEASKWVGITVILTVWGWSSSTLYSWLGIKQFDVSSYKDVRSFLEHETRINQAKNALLYYMQQLNSTTLLVQQRSRYESLFIDSCEVFTHQIELLIGYMKHACAQLADKNAPIHTIPTHLEEALDTFLIHVETFSRSNSQDKNEISPLLIVYLKDFLWILEQEVNSFSLLEKVY